MAKKKMGATTGTTSSRNGENSATNTKKKKAGSSSKTRGRAVKRPATAAAQASKGAGRQVYELTVTLIGGPLTEEFFDANPVVLRAVQMLGTQTLEKLHNIIFEAFDREDEHMYEFQVGAEQPFDESARRYVLASPWADPFESEPPAGTVERTTLADLGLAVKDHFFYWFDFGDDWFHEIVVVAILDEVSPGAYPKITQRVGASPPQYPDWDDDDGEDDDDDDEEEDDDRP